MATSDAEIVKRTKKLNKADHAYAFYVLAGYYADGECGMPQDFAKANELWLRAGELGCAEAYYDLGNSYYDGLGVEVDKKKAKHFYELSAKSGSAAARHNLGYMEIEAEIIIEHTSTSYFLPERGTKTLWTVLRLGSPRGVLLKMNMQTLYVRSNSDKMR